MSEETLGQANGAAPAGPETAPQIAVGAQFIRDLSFENPLGLEGMMQPPKQPEMKSIEVNTNARPVGENTYEVILSIRADAKIEDRTAFIVELSYGGAIQLSGVPEERAREVVLVEGPRHLFPFARAIVSDVVRDGGFPPLMINPIDFAAMYASQHENKDDEQQGEQGARQ